MSTGNAPMKWASSNSEHIKTDNALEWIFADLHSALQGARPDVAFVFAGPHHASNFARIGTIVNSALKPAHLLGCSGGGIIGGGEELEQRSAISVTTAIMPGVEIKSFHLQDGSLPGLDESPRRWEE